MILWYALLALLTPILAAVGLNHRDARREARRASEAEAERRAEADAERRRLEQARDAERRRREAAQEQQNERDYLIRGGGLRRWLEQLRLAEDEATRGRTARQRVLTQIIERLKERAGRCRTALPQEGSTWAVAASVVLGVVWALAGGTNLFLDVEVFRGIGHGYELAIPLAVLLVMGFAVVGIVLTDLIGFTHLVPGLDTLSRRVRIALPIGIALAVCVCLSQLPRIVENRSADVAAEVRRDEGQVAILKAAHAPVQLIQQNEGKTSAARDRLTAAKDVDAGLAVVAAIIEIATSWAAICLGLLIVAELAERRAREADEVVRTLQLESDGAPDRIQNAVLERVISLRMTDDEVALAFHPPAGLASAVPHDGPRPGGPADDIDDNIRADDRTNGDGGPENNGDAPESDQADRERPGVDPRPLDESPSAREQDQASAAGGGPADTSGLFGPAI